MCVVHFFLCSLFALGRADLTHKQIKLCAGEFVPTTRLATRVCLQDILLEAARFADLEACIMKYVCALESGSPTQFCVRLNAFNAFGGRQERVIR